MNADSLYDIDKERLQIIPKLRQILLKFKMQLNGNQTSF